MDYPTNGDGDWILVEALCEDCGHLWDTCYPVAGGPESVKCPKDVKHRKILLTSSQKSG